MLQFINYRMRVTVQDNRTLIGKFMAFDKHMNLIVGDCEEFRKITPKGKSKGEEREEKRPLGLVLIRGECVVSLSVEGPPPAEDSRLKEGVSATTTAGPGRGIPSGRGLAVPPVTAGAPMGLGGPVRGIGTWTRFHATTRKRNTSSSYCLSTSNERTTWTWNERTTTHGYASTKRYATSNERYASNERTTWTSWNDATRYETSRNERTTTTTRTVN